MSRLSLLRRNDRGAAAIEMALALPILVSMIYGLFQVGLLYQANAGMQHALGEGARLATLCIPSGTTCNSPSDTQIKFRMATKALTGIIPLQIPYRARATRISQSPIPRR